MSDRWTSRLSEYLDGELAAPERAALEAHLAECAGCRGTLEELRAVVARAGSVEPRGPERDLWPGIAARLTAGGDPSVTPLARRRERRTFGWTQLAAAAVAGMLISGVGVWAALGGDPATASAPVAGSPAVGQAVPVHYATGDYESTVAALERVLENHDGALDPGTVRVLRENLGIIDRAIADARAALAADPGSPYLNAHLAGAMRRKAELLRRATSLAQL